LLRIFSIGLSLTAALLFVSLGFAIPRAASPASLWNFDLKPAANGLTTLAENASRAGSPIMLRIFKAESELELWVLADDRFQLFATYPICFWSGNLGPKEREGDHQAPEGFYSVGAGQLHMTGRRPRSFNIGFPNALDRAFGRTGSYILVHGGCTSVGCFAMTDPWMAEIYEITERALSQGQAQIPVHIFPFRMTDANIAAQVDSKWYGFWRNLKEGYDAFETSQTPPRISVCHTRYVVEAADVPVDQFSSPSVATDACQNAGTAVVAANEGRVPHHLSAKRRMASSRSGHATRNYAVGRRHHVAIRVGQRARRL
jgi:murein L,D-transpeptidase YafK